MIVKELIERLKGLDQDREITYDSYESLYNYPIEDIEEKEDSDGKYYNIH